MWGIISTRSISRRWIWRSNQQSGCGLFRDNSRKIFTRSSKHNQRPYEEIKRNRRVAGFDFCDSRLTRMQSPCQFKLSYLAIETEFPNIPAQGEFDFNKLNLFRLQSEKFLRRTDSPSLRFKFPPLCFIHLSFPQASKSRNRRLQTSMTVSGVFFDFFANTINTTIASGSTR